MTRGEFPRYASHDDAHCFHCGSDWRGSAWPLHSGYAPGAGEWQQACEKCGHWTFYDLKDEVTTCAD